LSDKSNVPSRLAVLVPTKFNRAAVDTLQLKTADVAPAEIIFSSPS